MVTTQLGLGIDTKITGDIQTWFLHFPYLPPSKNVFNNWPGQWKASARKKWQKRILELSRELELPRMERIGLHATLYFPVARRRDPQNYSSQLWYWVPDGLVQAGVIPDDDRGRISWGNDLGMSMEWTPEIKREQTTITLTGRV